MENVCFVFWLLETKYFSIARNATLNLSLHPYLCMYACMYFIGSVISMWTWFVGWLGQSDCLSLFPKRAGSCSSVLLTEHLFLSQLYHKFYHPSSLSSLCIYYVLKCLISIKLTLSKKPQDRNSTVQFFTRYQYKYQFSKNLSTSLIGLHSSIRTALVN